MHTPYFFGYGSLVNTSTHTYPSTQPATLRGWRRVWKQTSLRDLAYLSVTPALGHQIDGLIAQVPSSDWSALDEREAGYLRSPIRDSQINHTAGPVEMQIYQVSPDHEAAPTVRHPILLSYLDVVVQGFHKTFGNDGVTRFFETTDGWDAPVMNDRSNPIYPRSQILTAAETALVDIHLAALGVRVVSSELR